jgi:hypothetical protein
LFLPDLVEAHMAQLGLQSIFSDPDTVAAPPAFT